MTATPLSEEHQQLIDALQRQKTVCGSSYTMLGIRLHRNPSGIHHYVNGRTLPCPDTFEKLVLAIGGNPHAEPWVSLYAATRTSYGKPATQSAGTAPDANKPKTMASKRPRMSGRRTALIMALVLFNVGLLMSALLIHKMPETSPVCPATVQQQAECGADLTGTGNDPAYIGVAPEWEVRHARVKPGLTGAAAYGIPGSEVAYVFQPREPVFVECDNRQTVRMTKYLRVRTHYSPGSWWWVRMQDVQQPPRSCW
ncbi:hypothetical protein [Streptomyces canus]|uniref:hypothetical protein n=1 Tax=Streptomyces canus TaxID=58343 RepID=UPI002DD85414|nr:hypothetical protein [Streptomyces canus]WSD82873.1 hypothetical protein OG925_00200 [Streptomyces canus]WSD91961.1 hypothetical protein OG925_50280 [Streptomyces canus]WSD92550.1 hypothetical protein OG925_50680 [Streptomyces canus]